MIKSRNAEWLTKGTKKKMKWKERKGKKRKEKKRKGEREKKHKVNPFPLIPGQQTKEENENL